MFILYPCLKSSQNCDAEQGWCTIWSIWILSKKKKTIKNKINNINFLIMIKNWYVYQIKSVKRNQVLKKLTKWSAITRILKEMFANRNAQLPVDYKNIKN